MIAALEETGELENTIIIFIEGDNGSTAEGKMNRMIIEWTKGITAKNEIRTQFGYILVMLNGGKEYDQER